MTISATQSIRDSHKVIRGLFRQFEAVDRRAHEMKLGVVREIFMMLEIDLRVEEEILFPAITSAAGELGKGMIYDCQSEHHAIRRLIRNLERRDINEEYFNTGFANLISTAEELFKREEDDLFYLGDSVLDQETYGGLSDQIERRRQELMNLPQFKQARPEVVQMPHGGEQKRKQVA